MPAVQLQIPLAETLRYSGVRGEADASLQSLAQSCIEAVSYTHLDVYKRQTRS